MEGGGEGHVGYGSLSECCVGIGFGIVRDRDLKILIIQQDLSSGFKATGL